MYSQAGLRGCYRAELLILYAQIIGDLVKELTDSATHKSGEPRMPHY